MLILCFPQKYSAQLSDSTTVSLITCRPGDEIYNAFGHTAIRIYDPENKVDWLFNYGMFSFDEPNFLIKFLKGKLEYWLGIEGYRAFANNYSNQRRSVLEQKLKLDKDQKSRLFQALRENARPANRRYLYDFFFDNCSTRPRDMLSKHITGIDFSESPHPSLTFRQLLDQYTVGHNWADFGIDLIIGKIADRKASRTEQMFLPEYLYFYMNFAKQNGRKIVSSERLLLDYEKEAKRRTSSSFISPVLIAILLLLFEIYLFLRFRKNHERWVKIYDGFWFTFLSLGGLLILFMWFGTDHIATKDNLNILWLHPLYLLLYLKKFYKPLYILLLTTLLLGIIQHGFIQSFHMASLLLILATFLKIIRRLFERLKYPQAVTS